MSREVRRVPMDFDWPQGKVWGGYLNPHYQHRRDCPFCDGSKYNDATKAIADDWYDFAGTGRKWCYSLTQDEVDALVREGRLFDFTRRPLNAEQATHPNGWTVEPNGYAPTAEEVNRWAARPRSMGHDAINRMICVEARATRLGVFGYCEHCDEDGGVWRTKADRLAYEAWTKTEPPTGDGWQMWETTSEGSPISPVFDAPEALARWLADNGASAFGSIGATCEQWLAMIRGPGWAMSAVRCGDGPLMSGVAAVSEKAP